MKTMTVTLADLAWGFVIAVIGFIVGVGVLYLLDFLSTIEKWVRQGLI